GQKRGHKAAAAIRIFQKIQERRANARTPMGRCHKELVEHHEQTPELIAPIVYRDGVPDRALVTLGYPDSPHIRCGLQGGHGATRMIDRDRRIPRVFLIITGHGLLQELAVILGKRSEHRVLISSMIVSLFSGDSPSARQTPAAWPALYADGPRPGAHARVTSLS